MPVFSFLPKTPSPNLTWNVSSEPGSTKKTFDVELIFNKSDAKEYECWVVLSTDSCNTTVILSVSTPLLGILYLIDVSEVFAVYLKESGSPWTSLTFSTNTAELSLFALAE